jgi:hypothetical protein
VAVVVLDIPTIVEFVQNFGFPIAVATWALWRLDKVWGQGAGLLSRIEMIEESLDRLEAMLVKNTDINNEIAITMKVMQTTMISHKSHGGERDK